MSASRRMRRLAANGHALNRSPEAIRDSIVMVLRKSDAPALVALHALGSLFAETAAKLGLPEESALDILRIKLAAARSAEEIRSPIV